MKTAGIKSIFGLAITALLLSMVFSCGSDIGTDTLLPSVTNSSGFASALPSSSSVAVHEYGYCLYPEYSLCLVGTYRDCPSGGILSEYCPFASSNSSQVSSSSAETSSSSSSDASISSSSSQADSSEAEVSSSSSNISISSSSNQADSSGVTQQLGYCVFYAEQVCMQIWGTWGDCSPPAYFSTACPYSSVPSSSSRPSSSSSIPSSSSVAKSSSSSVPSSSSSKPSSSSSIPSSSSVAKSSSSSAPSSSSSVPSSSSISSSSICTAANNTSTQYCSNGTIKTYGSVTYDGQTYKTVVIGTQTWMAENLNYNASGSKCYDNSEANCTKYGRLYDWATAMVLPSSCNSNSCSPINRQGVCPSGWHIPRSEDWNALMGFVNPSCSFTTNCANAGTELKATNGWNSYSGIPSGSDNYGFAALPGGGGDISNSNHNGVGIIGVWWSSTEGGGAAFANGWYMLYDSENVHRAVYYKNDLLSVRCVKN